MRLAVAIGALSSLSWSGAAQAGRYLPPEGVIYFTDCASETVEELHGCRFDPAGLLGGAGRIGPEVFRRSSDAAEPWRVTANHLFEFRPKWAPDGRSAAVSTSRWGYEEDCRLDILDLLTGLLRPVTPDPDLVCSSADDWSADGSWIVFGASWHDGPRDLYKVRPDGLGLTRLIALWDEDEWASWAQWMHDGRIVFEMSSRDYGYGIFSIDAYGRNMKQLVRSMYIAQVVRSPDRHRIAYVRNNYQKDPAGNEIYVMKPDGTGKRRLTFNRDHESSLAWSPDGKKIAFLVHRWGRRDVPIRLQVVDITTGRISRPPLPPRATIAYEAPVWSPSGRYLLYRAYERDRGYALFYSPVANGQPTRLTPYRNLIRAWHWTS